MISFWGVEFHLYGLIIGLAIVSAFQVSLEYAKRQRIEREMVEKIFWWMIIGGLIGARAYHVVDLWDEIYKLDLVQILYVWQGGLGIWGGILGGVAGLVGYRLFKFRVLSFKTKINLLSLMDVAAVGMPLGQAIGRLGNWANGELYGKNGEPLFAWEAGLNLILFAFLWKIGKKSPVSGAGDSVGKVSGGYLVGYGLIRILLENFRPEEIIWKWQGVPVAMIMGIMSLLVGAILWILSTKPGSRLRR